VGVGAGAADPLDELQFTTREHQRQASAGAPDDRPWCSFPLGGGFDKIGSFNPGDARAL